jgi:hypothetical protein
VLLEGEGVDPRVAATLGAKNAQVLPRAGLALRAHLH